MLPALGEDQEEDLRGAGSEGDQLEVVPPETWRCSQDLQEGRREGASSESRPCAGQQVSLQLDVPGRDLCPQDPRRDLHEQLHHLLPHSPLASVETPGQEPSPDHHSPRASGVSSQVRGESPGQCEEERWVSARGETLFCSLTRLCVKLG